MTENIPTPKRFNINMLLSCVILWFYIYCTYIVIFEFISLSTLNGFVLIFLVFSTHVVVWHFSLPQPDSALVNEVLGHDPKLMKFKKSSGLPGEEEQVIDDKEYFTVIGHRAAGLDAPENSISAVKYCHEKGCKMIEFDLVLTADDVPVLYHDDTVDRLSNATGNVQQMTWEQLKTLDIAEKHPLQERFSGERIALFNDVIELCLQLDMRMIIDIKHESFKTVEVILDIFKEHPALYKRALVSGFNPFLIYMIRSRDPNILCSLAWRPFFYSLKSYGRDTIEVRRYSSVVAHIAACIADYVMTWLLFNIGFYVLGLSAILLHKDAITSDVISYWEKKNIRVIAWTVNRPQEKLYISRVLHIAYITDTLVGESSLH